MIEQTERFTKDEEKDDYTFCRDLFFKRLHQSNYLKKILLSRFSISSKYQNVEYQNKIRLMYDH